MRPDFESQELDKKNNNQCKNCINAEGYGSLEGFYCFAKQCGIRGEQYNCEHFASN